MYSIALIRKENLLSICSENSEMDSLIGHIRLKPTFLLKRI